MSEKRLIVNKEDCMTIDEIINLMNNNEKQERYIQEHKKEIESRPYRLIIGDQAYKNKNDRIVCNIKPYQNFRGEVAFLSDNYKATMFFVVSFLLKSHDDAQKLIAKMRNESISMKQFAKILFKIFHLILINRNDYLGKMRDYNNIINIIESYKIDKVLFLGCNNSTTSKMLIRKLNQNGVKYEQILHPSPHGYSFDSLQWTQLYLYHNDHSLTRVKFADFQI